MGLSRLFNAISYLPSSYACLLPYIPTLECPITPSYAQVKFTTDPPKKKIIVLWNGRPLIGEEEEERVEAGHRCPAPWFQDEKWDSPALTIGEPTILQHRNGRNRFREIAIIVGGIHLASSLYCAVQVHTSWKKKRAFSKRSTKLS